MATIPELQEYLKKLQSQQQQLFKDEIIIKDEGYTEHLPSKQRERKEVQFKIDKVLEQIRIAQAQQSK